MDYKKKYETALERATQSWECGDMTREHLEYLFPELAEPEDEKIRKMLIEFFGKGAKRNSSTNGISDKDILDWLEKQGIKPQGKPALEAIHEQRTDNANKVERKFKVGDFIVNDYCKGKVIELTTDAYLLDTEQGIPFSCEHNAHLWTIADAKEGDVLYSLDSNQPFIYKERKQNEQATAYCGLNIYGKFFVWGTKDCVITLSNYVIATKEQRDTLFARMKEAGYVFDFENKQLRKIEQKSDSFCKKIAEDLKKRANAMLMEVVMLK